jgi:TPR repeat protein
VTVLKSQLIQAAERGDAEAQFNLAMIYENGLEDCRYADEGGRPEAMRWFRAAADQGLARAQLKLADICAGERERPDSSVEACGWYLVATASLRGAHLQKAQLAYRRIALHLTTEQSAEVRRFAQSWKPKPAVSSLSNPYKIGDRARA